MSDMQRIITDSYSKSKLPNYPKKKPIYGAGSTQGEPSISSSTSTGRKILIDDNFLDYFDLISEILGLDMKYEDFSKMDSNARKSYIKSIQRNKKFEDLDI